MKAVWNNRVIAESDDLVVVEGNNYFPMDSLNKEFIKKSTTQTVCHWKGTASYFSLEVDGMTNTDAVWYYHEPSEAAANIKNRVAFWKGVEVI